MTPADVELMRLFQAGCQDAFALLVRRHQQPLVNLFLRLGADVHGAEDCAQETFLRLFKYRDKYHATAPFPAFLYTLAHNAWVDWFRRASRWQRSLGARAKAAEPTAAPPSDDRLDLDLAVRALSPHLQWVVVLSVNQGLSYAEIAAVLGIPTGTVKSRMFHAIKKLREALHVPVEP